MKSKASPHLTSTHLTYKWSHVVLRCFYVAKWGKVGKSGEKWGKVGKSGVKWGKVGEKWGKVGEKLGKVG